MAGQKTASLISLAKAAAAALAVFSVATLFAELHRYLELFSHFRLQYFVSSLVLLLAFAVLRNRNFSLLLVALALLNAWFVLPWYVGDDRAGVVAGGASMKILQANVLRGNKETAALLAQIAAEKPDIVILQEMTPPWLKAMQSLSAEFPYSIAEAQDGAFGIGLFSKLPLEDARIVHAPPVDLPEIRVTVVLGEQRIILMSAHPMPPIGRASIEARNVQLAALGKELGAAARPTVLIGDLNISMWASTFRAFEESSGLRNGRKGFGIIPTFPVFLPIAGIPIDHCLVSEGIEVLEFRRGARTGSDHWPIIVTLALTD